MFDIEQILRDSPPFRVFVGGSWQRFRTGHGSYRIRSLVAFHEIFRGELDFTHSPQVEERNGEFRTLAIFRVLLRVPLRRFSIATGISGIRYDNRRIHYGPGSYFSVEYLPSSHIGFAAFNETFLIGRQFGRAEEIALLVGFDHFKFRSGYRWLDIDGDANSGPSVGFIFLF